MPHLLLEVGHLVNIIDTQVYFTILSLSKIIISVSKYAVHPLSTQKFEVWRSFLTGLIDKAWNAPRGKFLPQTRLFKSRSEASCHILACAIITPRVPDIDNIACCQLEEPSDSIF